MSTIEERQTPPETTPAVFALGRGETITGAEADRTWTVSNYQIDIGIIIGIINGMNGKHRKTLAAIFASPTPRSLTFRDIESLLRAIGCVVEERPGSAVGFARDNCTVGFHRPHPGKEAKPYQIKDVRDFLRRIGVEP